MTLHITLTACTRLQCLGYSTDTDCTPPTCILLFHTIQAGDEGRYTSHSKHNMQGRRKVSKSGTANKKRCACADVIYTQGRRNRYGHYGHGRTTFSAVHLYNRAVNIAVESELLCRAMLLPEGTRNFAASRCRNGRVWLSFAEPRLLALIVAWLSEARCGSMRSCAAHSLSQYPGTATGALFL